MIPIKNGEKNLLSGLTMTPASTPSTTTSFLIKHDKLADVFSESKLVAPPSDSSSDDEDLSYTDSEYTSYSEYSESDTYTDTYTVDDSSEYDSDDYSTDEEAEEVEVVVQVEKVGIQQIIDDKEQQQLEQSSEKQFIDDVEQKIITVNNNNNNKINHSDQCEINQMEQQSETTTTGVDPAFDIAASLHNLVQNHFHLLSSGFKYGLYSGDIFMEHLEILFFSSDMAKKYYDMVNAMPVEDIPTPAASQTRLYILKKTIDIVDKVNIYRSFMLEQQENEEEEEEAVVEEAVVKEEEKQAETEGEVAVEVEIEQSVIVLESTVELPPSPLVDVIVESKVEAIEEASRVVEVTHFSIVENPEISVDDPLNIQDLKDNLQSLLESPDCSFSDLGQFAFDVSELNNLNEKLESIGIVGVDDLTVPNVDSVLSQVSESETDCTSNYSETDCTSNYSETEDYSSSDSSSEYSDSESD
ncbi:hypothetical protein PPL_03633 [Heterostelium album PN500]|uniref:Uncharacterized protein n=1 Tax=Heterostelium pallidum (strain ATCC 26659 / Pp 5 / PN500) TaxID=670386 RepID=D3B5B8_HETP5|nr:hypothetical protein PPL_03633 [Heterostelium album PN500]EFA83483.1 hypothetical protein PPL_03633 [Heterostelium album PN500]|eukprot:XP_020435600.1 hypothetical protein PPL_03633 [Heterostelium album PN500]